MEWLYTTVLAAYNAKSMESEIYTGAPLPEPPRFQRARNKSWTELREVVRDIRCQLYHTACKTPTNVVFSTKDGGVRIYFLCSFATGRQVTLHYVDVTDDGDLSSCQTLFESKFHSAQAHCTSSKEEQLQLERKRLMMWGITSFNYVEGGHFVFTSSGSVFRCTDDLPLGGGEKGILPIEVRGQSKWSRLDPQMCPADPSIISYVANNDIWVYNCSTEAELRLTKVHDMARTLSAGVPCYVTQEEFNRFSGLWWSPNVTHSGGLPTFSILYEVVDESDVEVIDLPSANGGVEEFRFPRAGTVNAKSSLRVATFSVSPEGAFVSIRHRFLVNPFIYGAEYLLRAGWTEDGQYVWAEVLNRQQDTLQLVLMQVPPVEPNFCDITTDGAVQEDGLITNVMLLLEEKSSVWINVHDVLHFVATEGNCIELLWASEHTGYRHLYLYKIDKESGKCIEKTALTSGDWEVNDESVWLDARRRLVYFVGLKDSPLETQLYVVSLDFPDEVRCLTKPGASHNAFLSIRTGLAIIIESNLSQPAYTRLYRLTESTESNGFSAMCVDDDDCDSVILKRRHLTDCKFVGNIMEPASVSDRSRIPEIFSHQLSSGDTVYGVIFKPRSLDELRPQKFPTVLAIYGGPEVQLVTNSFKGMRHLRHHLLSAEDFCVVTMDCRGSRNRGVAFESHLRGRMGQVEIQDQVEVLQWLAEERGYIDMNRIAIHGWSYGGYLSLMGLAQRPDVFKLAVAGAPVTQWNLYDTGYTERYMGLPESNREGYHRGSVLSYVSQFPDEENRLLIIHGLMDENVHFAHTTSLIQALVKAGKPYRLQVYPQERHSLRHLATSEHYETTLLSFLQAHL